MKVYLDVSCLNRPTDDQSQARIRLEAEAVQLVLDRFDQGAWEHVSSEIVKIEIDAMPDLERRDEVRQLLPDEKALLILTEPVLTQATALGQLGIKRGDALHVASAEELKADVLLSCDDRLCRLARRRRGMLKVRVLNPLDWLEEIGPDANS